MEIIVVIGTGIIGAIIGFFLGQFKFFMEEKHRAYRELLPPILKAGYRPKEENEDDFNKALTKLWLYGNKEVTQKIDRAVSIMHDSQRGELTNAYQEAIIAMRKDLRMKWPFDRLKPDDVRHIYSKIGEGS